MWARFAAERVDFFQNGLEDCGFGPIRVKNSNQSLFLCAFISFLTCSCNSLNLALASTFLLLKNTRLAFLLLFIKFTIRAGSSSFIFIYRCFWNGYFCCSQDSFNYRLVEAVLVRRRWLSDVRAIEIELRFKFWPIRLLKVISVCLRWGMVWNITASFDVDVTHFWQVVACQLGVI